MKMKMYFFLIQKQIGLGVELTVNLMTFAFLATDTLKIIHFGCGNW